MYRQWSPPDPTRSPWKTSRQAVTTCRFCEHEYASITIREQDNHHAWCQWWQLYERYLHQQRRDV